MNDYKTNFIPCYFLMIGTFWLFSEINESNTCVFLTNTHEIIFLKLYISKYYRYVNIIFIKWIIRNGFIFSKISSNASSLILKSHPLHNNELRHKFGMSITIWFWNDVSGFEKQIIWEILLVNWIFIIGNFQLYKRDYEESSNSEILLMLLHFLTCSF